jgi:rhamnosyltransferase
VSIVLPTRNGIQFLPRVLDAIAGQQVDAHVEVVAIDTESDDGSAELLRARATRFLQIARGSFNHGRTRNEAIRACDGELIVLISQDAEPADRHWLAALIAPLQDRPAVAGTYARQCPRDSSGAIVRHYHSAWMGSSTARHVSRVDAAGFDMLDPLQRMRLCTFDNVCSCIRRSVWCQHPFKTTPIAEDLEWSKDVLLAGYEIEFVPAAVVVHSHDRTAWYELKRTMLLHQRLHTLFGVRTIPSLSSLARAIASTTKLHLSCRRSSDSRSPVESFTRALALAVAWPAGQYLGGLAGTQGWTLHDENV